MVTEFGCNFVMQKVSYSFYKSAKQKTSVKYVPEHIMMSDKLSGYGINIDTTSDGIILFFGGSGDIAYNAVGSYGGNYDMPFVSADYYGSQQSAGKMNLKSMKQTAVDMYDWAKAKYPDRKITVIGHSYGTGMATYLASERNCDHLILLASYRDLSDLYNKIIPIFWGPLKVFISNDIRLSDYAKEVKCDAYIIGSDSDKTLSAKLQYKVQGYFTDAKIKIFADIAHADYMNNTQVTDYINNIAK